MINFSSDEFVQSSKGYEANCEKTSNVFNPFMKGGLSYLSFSDSSIANIRGVWIVFFIIPCFIEIPVRNTNSVDPDQMPRSAASDLVLHCQCPFYRTLGLNRLIN